MLSLLSSISYFHDAFKIMHVLPFHHPNSSHSSHVEATLLFRVFNALVTFIPLLYQDSRDCPRLGVIFDRSIGAIIISFVLYMGRIDCCYSGSCHKSVKSPFTNSFLFAMMLICWSLP